MSTAPTAPPAPTLHPFAGEDLRLLLALTASVRGELECMGPNLLATLTGAAYDDAALLGLADFLAGAVGVVRAHHGGLSEYCALVAQQAGGVPLYDVSEQLALHLQIAAQTVETQGGAVDMAAEGRAAGLALVRQATQQARTRGAA